MENLSQYIDHTLLSATATSDAIKQLCEEAKTYQFHAVCVNSCYASLANEQLKNSQVKVCCVVGFPLGAMSTEAKVAETKQAILDGAEEIDMVINLGYLKSKNFDDVWTDIEEVKKCIPNGTLKVILETCYLDDIEIIKASELAIQSGADYIKTSTGFGTSGATIHVVKIMKSVAQDYAKVKASGGIKDYETAKEYINLGVERIGTSSGIAIVTGISSSNKTY
ncbi:deoxyribose-phosphate aldolase [Gaetbulibacter saemankumensis]|uniref:deoxyribose-phosphate aldolase n=1 Tax=Gaetbulibacter saemankumensis TaxID=311208 RepID=UPI000416734E|nr:deoxyribose-phosphate aldolase [Gaetbulibacter saemankumensis]